MRKILVCVDLQVDFINGVLGSKEAQAIIPNVVDKIKKFDGNEIYYTLDTHHENYMDTQEGKKLPVKHCVEHSMGWMLNKEVDNAIKNSSVDAYEIRKPTFGSVTLANELMFEFEEDDVFEIEFIGVCTDICVISNAMLIKAFFPEAKVVVDASCCAGVTPESHKNALEAMKMCQIEIVNE